MNRAWHHGHGSRPVRQKLPSLVVDPHVVFTVPDHAVLATGARYPECLKMRDVAIAVVVEPHRGVGAEPVGHLLPNQIGYDGLNLVILERLPTDRELVARCVWARFVSTE